MARVSVSLMAQADSDRIVRRLARVAGLRTARRYLADFEAVYERLAAHPESGAPRPALNGNARISVVSPYLIIYVFDEVRMAVTIVRIVH